MEACCSLVRHESLGRHHGLVSNAVRCLRHILPISPPKQGSFGDPPMERTSSGNPGNRSSATKSGSDMLVRFLGFEGLGEDVVRLINCCENISISA